MQGSKRPHHDDAPPHPHAKNEPLDTADIPAAIQRFPSGPPGYPESMSSAVCRPGPDRAVCAVSGCTYHDEDGNLEQGGRERLLEYLTEPEEHTGKPWFTTEEAAQILDHVSPRVLVLYLLGKVGVGGAVQCDRCGGWVASFHDNPNSTYGTLANQTCPYHPDGRPWGSSEVGDNAPGVL